jgi:hypothetical protein
MWPTVHPTLTEPWSGKDAGKGLRHEWIALTIYRRIPSLISTNDNDMDLLDIPL